MAVASALVLLLGHDVSFSTDEIDWFAATPALDIHSAFAPYNGHLIIGERLVYAAMFHVFGVTYLPYRVLGLLSAFAAVAMLFVFARRRVGATIALLPCLVLLVYGADANHLLLGNGFGDLAPLALGIAALLALERNDRAGDLAACALLIGAISLFSVGLAFVGGAAVLTLADRQRRRRAWVVVVPIALYAIWLVASHGQAANTGENVKPWNLLLAPIWTADSLGSVGSSLAGLNYPDFATDWKPMVAVALAILIGLRLRRGLSPWLLATMAIPLTLWALAATAAQAGERIPEAPRYMFPGTVCLLIFAAEAARNVAPRRTLLIALSGIAAFGIATNVVLLGQGSNALRDTTKVSRIDLAALEAAGGRLGLGPPPNQLQAGADPGLLLWQVLSLTGGNGVATGYLEAVDRFGSPAYTPAELSALPEADRDHADAALASTLSIALQPTGVPAHGGACTTLTARSGGPISVPIRAGGVVLSSATGGTVGVRRFGSVFPAPVGTLPPHAPRLLAIPGAGESTPPWFASVTAPRVTACAGP